ncbi:YEATS-associated helix-containing protein [Rhodobium gokarnense]|uniref:YEATS-Like-Associating Three TM domain-containing protein n=1 Tax=Rhodobium gokarnense TaxID=364296 RepID=A0ABT3H9B3_9HYPH|nr:YEATS-associated helix-containing protein [Rhodobium gokarnense]MCW2306980.1 hypothetical protein [Rhodobium gokarnense]
MADVFGWNQVVAVTAMVAGGALGGYVSSILARFAPVDDPDPPAAPIVTVKESITAGIASAFVVPVFLSVASMGVQESLISNVFQPISSNDCEVVNGVNLCRSFLPSLMLLVAFCVVVGASYRAFFASLSRRLLESLQSEVKELDNELQNRAAAGEIPKVAEPPAGTVTFSGAEGVVFHSLLDQPRTRGAVEALATNENVVPEKAGEALAELVSMGLVEEVRSIAQPGKTRFRINADAVKARVSKDANADQPTFYVK